MGSGVAGLRLAQQYGMLALDAVLTPAVFFLAVLGPLSYKKNDCKSESA